MCIRDSDNGNVMLIKNIRHIQYTRWLHYLTTISSLYRVIMDLHLVSAATFPVFSIVVCYWLMSLGDISWGTIQSVSKFLTLFAVYKIRHLKSYGINFYQFLRGRGVRVFGHRHSNPSQTPLQYFTDLLILLNTLAAFKRLNSWI